MHAAAQNSQSSSSAPAVKKSLLPLGWRRRQCKKARISRKYLQTVRPLNHNFFCVPSPAGPLSFIIRPNEKPLEGAGNITSGNDGGEQKGLAQIKGSGQGERFAQQIDRGPAAGWQWGAPGESEVLPPLFTFFRDCWPMSSQRIWSFGPRNSFGHGGKGNWNE